VVVEEVGESGGSHPWSQKGDYDFDGENPDFKIARQKCPWFKNQGHWSKIQSSSVQSCTHETKRGDPRLSRPIPPPI